MFVVRPTDFQSAGVFVEPDGLGEMLFIFFRFQNKSIGRIFFLYFYYHKTFYARACLFTAFDCRSYPMNTAVESAHYLKIKNKKKRISLLVYIYIYI